MRVTVLGAGAGGVAAVAELTAAGHEVSLWNRSASTLAPFLARGGIEYEGVLGEGLAVPRVMTTDLATAVKAADVGLVCMPTTAHAAVAQALAEVTIPRLPVVLNPGHTGGALAVRTVFVRLGRVPPPIAEFSTLTYVARKYQPGRVTVTGRARQVRLAAVPGGEAAIDAARALYDSARCVPDVLNTSLANVNMVLHPPGTILGAAWIEARRGEHTFYVEGMTTGVARVMRALDEERRSVAAAFGHTLPSVTEEMQALGTVEPSADPADLAGAIAGGVANRRIKAPDSLGHRYFVEDFGHGLLPFCALATAAGVETPVAGALLRLAMTILDTDFATGRTAAAMGIAGLDRDGVLAAVRGARDA